MLVKDTYESPVGRLILAADEEGLAALYREEYCHYPPELTKEAAGSGQILSEKAAGGGQILSEKTACEPADSRTMKNRGPGAVRTLELVKDWLDRYFDGVPVSNTEIPLAPRGSAFRREVWEIVRDIPYGQLITYGEIAQIIASRRGIRRMAAQAVGGAVGHNPISIIVPCHRVIGTGGNLTGYGGSMWVKKWLLAHEGLDLSQFYDPEEKH